MDSKDPKSADMIVVTKSRKDCPFVQVTVYKDRAQVSRTLLVDLKEGIHELHITDFVDIDEDSIRVEGKGNATIAEVSFQTEKEVEDLVTFEGKEKDLREKLRVLNQELENLSIAAKKEVLNKEKKLLDEFFNRAASSGIAPDSQEITNVQLAEPFLTGVRAYMTEYRSLSYSLISDNQELEKKEKELIKEKEVLEEKLRFLWGNRLPSERKRECIVVLDSHAETKVELTLSYIVLRASWIPSYDLRMFTDQGKLKLFYYGLISQSSGEDWNDTKIFLSTAEPSFGGNIPKIPISHLSFYEPYEPTRRHMFSAPITSRMASPAAEYSDICQNGIGGGMDFDFMAASPAMDVAEVKVVDKTTSTSYEIARNSSIPCDNSPHKVTVAILDFDPELSYVTVPKASPNAFLRAKVVNTSAYMLLAGESSIFLDNSFIAKAHLHSAAPKEEFTCSLGVDPSVRVTYKPIIKMKSSSGILTKTETNLCEQIIEVKNLHDKEVKVLVQDSLPKSRRDKIKVVLLSPNIDPKHPEKSSNVCLTKYNVVEWNLTVGNLATKEVVLKYSIEHPSNQTVESSSDHVAQEDV